jgi:membrane associated rhomboid family serine protease
MFPLRDDNPTLGRSIATLLVIGLNAACWIFVQGLGGEPALSSSVCRFGAIPGDLLGLVPDGTRLPMGHGLDCVIRGDPNWLTPFTSMFMHGGWFHIIGNLWFLWVFGDNVEDSMGALRFLVFYVLCGLAAVAVQTLANPSSAVPMVGASGAIGGVMGAYALLYPRVPVHMMVVLGFYIDRIAVPAYLMLGYWLMVQVIGGLPTLGGGGAGVAFWAHVGGFVAGLGLAPLFRVPALVEAHRELLERHARERDAQQRSY